MHSLRAWSWLLLVVASAAIASGAAAEMYRYVDDEGRSHFTDSFYEVPARYREQLREISGDLEADDRLNVIEGLHPRTAQEDEEPEPASGFAGVNGVQDLENLDFGQMGLAMLMGAALVFAVVMVMSLFLSALLLRWACRLADVEEPGLLKAMGVCLLQAIGSGFAGGALDFTLALGGGPSLAAIGMRLVLGLVVSVLVYASVLRALVTDGFGDAVKVTLIYWLVAFLIGFAAAMALVMLGGFAATI